MLTCMNGHREIERLNNQPVPNLFIESVYFSVTVLSDTAVLSKFLVIKVSLVLQSDLTKHYNRRGRSETVHIVVCS